MGAALLLAVVAGAGVVPIPESVMHFPDPAAFTGTGVRQQATMVTTALQDAGAAMRASGPGPQQIVHRWVAGQLNAAEQVAVLLGGAAFHHPALLRIYDEATRSPDARVRKAAVVGVFALIGDAPPLPAAIADTPADWEKASAFVRSLGWATRVRTLVGIWSDSYAATRGASRADRFVLRRSGLQCLKAIRELAQPHDLQELIALWPLLASDSERAHLMQTIEMVTFQRLVPAGRGANAPSGAWQVNAAVATVDSWVARTCGPVDGEAQAERAAASFGTPAGAPPLAKWFGVLQARYPAVAPLALERLAAVTGIAVTIDRQSLANPANDAAHRKVAEALPISAIGQERQPRRR